MASLNMAQIIGNLGADPDMRYTPNGNAVTTFNVACNEAWTGGDGEKREEVEWFSVVCWNKLAENCAEYLEKGRQVYVQGRMKTRSWDGQDGVKHYKTELVAQHVTFLGSGGGGGQRAEPAVGVASGTDVDDDDRPF